MERFIKGDIVVVPFPFTNFMDYKRRPALVVAELERDDLILCQITSQNIKDRYSISLEEGDFKVGTLRKKSNVRPNRIFTADRGIVVYKAGHIKEIKIDEIVEKIIEIIKGVGEMT